MEKTNRNKTAVVLSTVGLFFLFLLVLAMASVAKASSANSIAPFYFTGTGTPPTPTIFSLAYNKPVTSSESCGSYDGPENAVDGVVFRTFQTNWYASNWCSSVEDKWIRVDLGADYYISSIQVLNAGYVSSAGNPYNTRDFTVYGMKDLGGSKKSAFRLIGTVTNNTYPLVSVPLPATIPYVRYIKINVTNGAQPGQANIARIYEIVVTGVLTLP